MCTSLAKASSFRIAVCRSFVPSCRQQASLRSAVSMASASSVQAPPSKVCADLLGVCLTQHLHQPYTFSEAVM